MLKYEYVDGCGFSLNVNGVESVDMEAEELRGYIERLVGLDNDFEGLKKTYLTVSEIMFYLHEYDDEKDTVEFWEKFEEDNIDKDESLESIKAKLLVKIKEEDDWSCLQTVFKDLMERVGEYKDLGYCETCGSYSVKYTLELED
jgi:hypothetical protein